MKLRRYKGNPITEPRGDGWESLATFNPAAIEKDGKVYSLYRAIGDYFNYSSRLGLAIFDKELNLIDRKKDPVFEPDPKLWELSIEDPRITKIGEEYYMTYVTTITPAPPFGVRKKIGLPKPFQAYSKCAVAQTRDLSAITPDKSPEKYFWSNIGWEDVKC